MMHRHRMFGQFRPFFSFILLALHPMVVFSVTSPIQELPQYKGASNCNDVIIDLAFVLDSSASVTKANFELTKEFVKDFLMPADIDGGAVRVSVVVYSTTSQLMFHLNEHQTKSSVMRAIDAIPYRPGNTNTASALRVLREDVFSVLNGDRPEVDNIAIVVTDGTSNSKVATANQAKLARRANIHLYALGVGLIDTRELDQIASYPPEENRINVPDFTRLKTLATKVFTTQCKCRSQADVVFMLGTSTQIGVHGFNMMKEFVSDAVRDLQTSNDYFRAGLMIFSDFPKVVFNLNSTHPSDKQKMHAAVLQADYVPGSTNLALALRVVRTAMMKEANGNRPDVPNILVIVTDGLANDTLLETRLEIRRLKATGNSVVFITVGPQGKEELRKMTSPPVDANFIEVVDLDYLPTVASSLVHSFCYDLDTCAHNPCQNEGICLPGLRSYTCLCQNEEFGTHCEKACGQPSDVVLLLDSSTPVDSSIFARIISHAQMLVSSMDLFVCDVRIGVMTYSSTARIELNLDSYDSQEEVIGSMDRIRFSKGRSNLANALKIIRTKLFNGVGGDRPDAQNIVFLVTGGAAKTFRDRTLSEAELFIDSGIQLIPVNIDTSPLDGISLVADTGRYPLAHFNTIEALLAMSSQASIHSKDDRKIEGTFCAHNQCLNGGICVFNEKTSMHTCKCPDGVSGRNCEHTNFQEKADVVFAVDSSRVNSPKEFQRIKRFLRRFLEHEPFGTDNLRVAVVSFASASKIRLSLASGNTKSVVISAIKSLRRMRGRANPARVLNLVNKRVLKTGHGDRSDAPNHVVLITSDLSNPATIGAVNRLKVQGTKVIGIGIRMPPPQKKLLQAAVSYPSEKNMFIVNRASQLKRLNFPSFASKNSRCVTDNPCRNTGVCVDGVGMTDYHCQCSPGFAGKDCETQCQSAVDMVIVMDSDRASGLDWFRHAKKFAHRLADSVNVGRNTSRVGVVTTRRGSRSRILLKSSKTKRALHSLISGIPYKYGKRNLTSVILFARNRLFSKSKGNRANVPDLMVIITGTEPDVHQDKTFMEAIASREQGITVVAIGVGLHNSHAFDGIVTPPIGGNVFVGEVWSQPQHAENFIMDKICNSGDVCASNPCHHDGVCTPGTQSQSQSQSHSYQCTCSLGFRGTQCEHECAHQKDIAIILDTSGDEVARSKLILMASFLDSLVNELTERGEPYRFALVVFNGTSRRLFSFHDTVEGAISVLGLIHNGHWSGSGMTSSGSESSASIGDKIDLLRPVLDVFDSDYGDRPDVEDVALFITQGQSEMRLADAISTADDLKTKKVKVIAIGVDSDKTANVDRLASTPEDVFKVKSVMDLNSIREDVIRQACSYA